MVTYTCTTGREESDADKLCSILAQLEFRHVIKEWDQKGVNFSQHLFVPEVHPIMGVGFCEMEDEGHVFKVDMSILCVCVCVCVCVHVCEINKNN